MASDEHVILEDVTACRGGRAVLSSFSLRIRERLVGLVGANGSGKSTLLRLAHGLMLPEAGSVRTLGLDTRTDQRVIPSRVGFLFQSPDRQILFPTVGEEVAFSFEVDEMPRKDALKAAQACLARFGRAHWADRPIGELSEGERQLACLIAVMAREPGLLLLDEPFASLDLATRRAFSQRLDGLGIPLVMASHDLDFLAGFDRVVWLEDGRIEADGAPQEILPAFRESMKARALRMMGSAP